MNFLRAVPVQKEEESYKDACVRYLSKRIGMIKRLLMPDYEICKDNLKDNGWKYNL